MQSIIFMKLLPIVFLDLPIQVQTFILAYLLVSGVIGP
jgi:hypothetical protein